MKYEVLKEELVFDGFFQVRKAIIKHDMFSGEQMTVERLSFGKADAVAILMYESDTDNFIFVRQFRYPTIKEEDGWVLEIPAGGTEAAFSAEDQMRHEVMEETGYRLDELQLISSFFSSPGMMIERMYLYYAEVDSSDKVDQGGGLAQENEDLEIVKIQKYEAKKMLLNNQFRDGKTIVALQWYFLNFT